MAGQEKAESGSKTLTLRPNFRILIKKNDNFRIRLAARCSTITRKSL